jgi:hypothetical protein
LKTFSSVKKVRRKRHTPLLQSAPLLLLLCAVCLFAAVGEKHEASQQQQSLGNFCAVDRMKRSAASSTPGASPPKFPKVHEYAGDIYKEDIIHRDNSPFLAELAKHKAAIFLRPMQLGKTSLFTLAELVYSKRKTAPTNLKLHLPPEEKNSSFVLRIDFGNVSAATNSDWKFRAADFDKAARRKVEVAVERLISDHDLRPLGNATEPSAGDLLDELVTRIRCENNGKPKLLVLVDEYDKPVREVLLNLIATDHGDDEVLRREVKDSYRHYISFFDTCKTALADIDMNVWVTGITPIGLSWISGFNPDNLTFEPSMADVVGILRENVSGMLDAVDQYNPFKSDDEKDQVAQAIEKHFNSLRYEGGGGLYHTRMVNKLMAGRRPAQCGSRTSTYLLPIFARKALQPQ